MSPVPTDTRVAVTHQVASVLLGYPDEELYRARPVLREAVAGLGVGDAAERLGAFLDHLDATPLPELAAQVEYVRVGDDLQRLMAYLEEQQGIRTVLCEGGPTLNSHLFAADLVDELFLSLNPKIPGGAAALTIVAGRELVEPAELELVSVAEGDGDLFTRWRVRHPA